MIDQIKSIQAKIENLVNDLQVLSREVSETENRDKVSLELEKKLNEKSLLLSRKELEYNEKIEQLQKDRDEISNYSQKIVKKENENFKKAEELNKAFEAMGELKKELTKREADVLDNEELKKTLLMEKETFEILKGKFDKDREVDRERKLLLDERERKIEAKEEMLKRRLNV